MEAYAYIYIYLMMNFFSVNAFASTSKTEWLSHGPLKYGISQLFRHLD